MKFYIHQTNLDLGIQNTAVALVTGIRPCAQSDETLQHWCDAALQRTMLSDLDALGAHPYVEEWRNIYRRLGYNPKKLSLPAYSLVRLIQKRAAFPRISPAVDAYNCAVVEHFIAIGAHDADKISGDVYFSRAQGEEIFRPVGSETMMPVKPGDFLYHDAAQVLGVLASRDSEDAKLSPGTTNILLVSEANCAVNLETVKAALTSACENIVQLCGGSYNLAELETTV